MVRVVVCCFGALGVLAGTALTLTRLFGAESRWGAILVAVAPLALLAYPAGGLLLVAGRWGSTGRVRAGLTAAVAWATVGAALHVVWMAPMFVGGHPAGPPGLTLMTLNLRLGEGDPDAAATLARRTGAEVVVLEEVTPLELNGLMAAGLADRLPYHAGRPESGASGTVVFSRYPLTGARELPLSKGGVVVRVGAPHPFTLVGLHAGQPVNDLRWWRADLGLLLRESRTLTGPLVMAGDFNSTLDHAPMRRLLGAGMADAARESNAGWQPTWPAAVSPSGSAAWLPSLITLDHVLTRAGYAATGTSTYLVAGTDHRALVAGLAWRP